MADDLIGNETQTEVKKESSETTTVVDELVGEGKKYNNVEALAKSKTHADEHISKLEFENANMREELTKLEEARKESKTIDDVIHALENRPTETSPANQTGTDSVDVKSLVAGEFNRRAEADRANENQTSVNAELINQFNGDVEQAKTHLQKVREDSGLSVEQFKILAQTSPVAALRILNINPPQSKGDISVTSRGNLSPEAPPINSNRRNKSYYDALRKDMGIGKFYDDIKLQTQMQEDFASLGDDWSN